MQETFVIYHRKMQETWHVADSSFDGGRNARWEELLYCLYSPQVPDAVRSSLQKLAL